MRIFTDVYTRDVFFLVLEGHYWLGWAGLGGWLSRWVSQSSVLGIYGRQSNDAYILNEGEDVCGVWASTQHNCVFNYLLCFILD